MTLTVTDLFAGAGGSTTGAFQVPGVHVQIAANHNQIVTDIHALNHQATDHAVVDLHEERPGFFPKTDILWASPECTKWSQASGNSGPAIEEGLFEDPLSDDAKNRSRLLMFDVLRFIEHHRYRLVIVENVVDIATQVKYRTAWTVWRQELRALGYEFRVMSVNSMHAQVFGLPAPQSRDRIYIVAWPVGEKAPDLERAVRPPAYCYRCDTVVESTQSWKPKREVGRYRQAYVYCCSRCSGIVEPFWMPALSAIDFTIPGQRIGDREKALATKTRKRIAHGIARWWGPLHLEAAGNSYDAADPNHLAHDELDAYYRVWPIEEQLRALHTTNSKALAVPVEGREGVSARTVDEPFRTMTTRQQDALAHLPFLVEMYGTSRDGRPITDPAGAFLAGGNHHGFVLDNNFENRARSLEETLSTVTTASTKALITRHYGMEGGDPGRHTTPADEVMRTLTKNGGNMSLMQNPFILDRRGEYRVRSIEDPLSTITANDTTKALIHRMNGDGDAVGMTTPLWEALRTLTAAGNQALLSRPAEREKRSVTAADLRAAEEMVDDVLFRMFQPPEVASGMAFPDDYQWQPPDRNKPISNRDLVSAAGNAVCPPNARDLVGISVEELVA